MNGNLVSTGLGGIWSVPSYPLLPGQNAIVARVLDDLGRSSQDAITVTLNGLVLGISNPSASSILNSRIVQVTGTVNWAGATVSVNGVAASVQPNGQWSAANVPLPEGPADIIAAAQSPEGRSATARITVQVDTVAPGLSVFTPTDNSSTRFPFVSVTGQVAETGARVFVAGVEVPVAADRTFVRDNVPLVTGLNSIAVEARDAAGNSTIITVRVTLDNVAPQIAITSPANGSATSNRTPTIVGTVNDPLSTVMVGTVQATRTVGDGWQAQTTTLIEGLNTITARATDPAGNQSSAQIQITLDTVLPTIQIASPANNAVVSAATIDVSGSISEAGTGVTVNGVTAIVSGLSFIAPGVPLSVGSNPVQAVVTDRAGNTGNASITVLREAAITDPPVVNAPTTPTNLESVTLTGAAPAGATRVRVRGGTAEATVNVAAGAFSITSYLNLNQLNQLLVLGVSASGAEGPSAQVNVRQDSVLPAVQILAPEPSSQVPGPNVVVVAQVSDDVALGSVTIGGQPAIPDAQGYAQALLNLGAGQHTVVVSVLDLAGNPNQASVLFTVTEEATDTQPPVVTIIRPTNGSWVSLSPASLQAIIADQSALQSVSVNGAPVSLAQVSGGVLSTSVTLVQGDNTVTVEATDVNALTGSDSIQVRYEPGKPAQPSIVSVSPPSPTRLTVASIRGTYTDGYRVRISGGAETVEVLVALGQWQANVPLTLNTTNHLQIVGLNPAGTASDPQTRDLIQDSTAPQVVSVQPVAGSEIPLNGTFRVTFSEAVKDTTLAAGIKVKVVGGAQIAGTVTPVSSTEADWQPTALLPSGRAIQLEVNTAIQDLASNPLPVLVTFNYTTEVPPPLPAIVLSPAAPGWTNQAAVTLTGTTSPNAVVTATGSQGSVQATADASGGFTLQVTLQTNMANAFSLVATLLTRTSPSLDITIYHDSVVPTVSILPANGDLTVIPGTAIVFTFNEPVQAGDLPTTNTGTGTLSVMVAGVAPRGQFVADATLQVVTFVPEALIGVAKNVTATAKPVIRDRAGNGIAAAVSSTFQYHDTEIPPAPVVTEIQPGNPTSSTLATIIGTVVPGNSVEVLDNRGLQVDTPTNPQGIFALEVALLPNQLNPFSLTARNLSGVAGPSTQVTIRHDDTRPRILNILPAGSSLDPTALTASATFSEAVSPATALLSGILQVTSAAGFSFTGVPTLSDDGGALSLPLPTLPFGTEFTVTVAATLRDLAGNLLVAGGTGTFTTMARPPQLGVQAPTITSIDPPSPTKSLTVTITGFADPEAMIQVTGGALDNQVAADTLGDFQIGIELRPNEANALQLIASTPDGNSAPTIVTVVNDTLGPNIAIEAPVEGSTVPAGTVTLLGTVADLTGITQVTVGPVNASIDGTRWSASLPLASGPQQVTVVATDPLGNASNSTVSFTVATQEESENMPPYLVVTEPAELATVPKVLIVHGTAYSAVGLTLLTVNGVAADITTDTFHTQVYFDTAGPNTVTAIATDTQSRTTTVVRNIIVDTTGPTITLDPVPARVVDPVIEITGTTQPGATVVIQLGSASDQTVADGTGHFRILTPRMALGPNPILLYAISTYGAYGPLLRVEVELARKLFDLTSFAPGPDAQDQSALSPVVLTFSAAVNRSTLVLGTGFTIRAGNVAVDGELTWSDDSKEVTFRPANPLPAGSTIVCLVSSEVTSADGNKLGSDLEWNYQIAEHPASLSGVVLAAEGAPLAGSLVRFLPAGPEGLVGAHGKFTINEAPGGPQTLYVDATNTSVSGSFGTLSLDVQVNPGEDNTLPRPIFLTPINMDSATPVNPTTGTLVNFQGEVPGLELGLEGGSLTMPDGNGQGVLTATEVSINRLPGRLDNGDIPSILVKLEPSGTQFDPPASFTLPNRDGLPPGTKVRLFAFEGGANEQVELGYGYVTEDGLYIKSETPVLGGFSYLGYRPDYVIAPTQTRILSGRVIDSLGRAIPGASVTALADDQRVFTDQNGAYRISLPRGNVIGVRVTATVSTSPGQPIGVGQVLILESDPVDPLPSGITPVPDIVVQVVEVTARLRLERFDGSPVETGTETTVWSPDGDLVSIRDADLAGAKLMLFRRDDKGAYSGDPWLVASADEPTTDPRWLRVSHTSFRHGGINETLPLYPGEVLLAAAVFPAVGHLGMIEQPLMEVAPGSLSVAPLAVDLRCAPPDVKFELEREYEIAGTRYRRPILPGGAALATDQLVLVRTKWSVRGNPLPTLPGVQLFGRQIIKDAFGITRQSLFSIPTGTYLQVLQIQGTFSDSRAVLDVVKLPGERTLEVSADRSFATNATLPVNVTGTRSKLKKVLFRVIDSTEVASTDPSGIHVAPPDAAGIVLVVGDMGTVNPYSYVRATNQRTYDEAAVQSDGGGRFELSLPGQIGDILQIDAVSIEGIAADPIFIQIRPVPFITAIVPDAARVEDPIIVQGRGFDPDPARNEVRFTGEGGVTVYGAVLEAAADHIRVQVPFKAADGLVRVATNGEVSEGTAFAVLQPVLLDPAPTSVTVGLVHTVNIHARYTSWTRPPLPRVTLGDLSIRSMHVVDDTTLAVDVASSQSAALGYRPIRVVHNRQLLYRGNGLLVRLPTTAPTLLSVDPSPANAGGVATLHLTNLFGREPSDLRVSFGDQQAGIVGVGPDTIDVVVPGGNSLPAVQVSLIGPGGPLVTNALVITVNGAGVNLPIAVGQTIPGELTSTVSIDRYRFTGLTGNRRTIRVNRLANPLEPAVLLNPSAGLYSPFGGLVAYDDDGGTNVPAGPGNNALILNVLLPVSGEYTIVVRGSASNPGGGPTLTTDPDTGRPVMQLDLDGLLSRGPYQITLE